MHQLRFSRCLSCGQTYQHAVLSGYGPLYCPDCRQKIAKAKAADRQRRFRDRKRGMPK